MCTWSHQLTLYFLTRESLWFHFPASNTCNVSSDNNLTLNLTIPFFSLEHLCDEHLLWYLFPRSSGDRKQYDFALLFASPAFYVRLFQLFQKKLLGNRKRHHPGFLSGKWNPESGSQTSNHTFVSFIHYSLCCAARKA